MMMDISGGVFSIVSVEKNSKKSFQLTSGIERQSVKVFDSLLLILLTCHHHRHF